MPAAEGLNYSLLKSESSEHENIPSTDGRRPFTSKSPFTIDNSPLLSSTLIVDSLGWFQLVFMSIWARSLANGSDTRDNCLKST